ncbi:cyclic GMP-AMP synthase-like isoform X2 [Mercenaria mercenaria]|uniref:cyclic GMP-AMP synthase-like isoform X2 n=1 Tax=Mercenaria mercenaria TaxID=6596 RepID=UPI00234F3CF8|nr:cyclic GMP-AMP synthase-like isoform X2 [Mercenaria mercenaria]
MEQQDILAIGFIVGCIFGLMCVVGVITVAIIECLKECCDGYEKTTVDYSLLSVVVDDSYSSKNNNAYYDQETTYMMSETNSCDFCGDDFIDSFHLDNHHRTTHFAMCRLEKYKQVRLADSAKDSIKAKCEQARLHMDRYHKCKDAVMEVLENMLTHSSNRGRFCKLPDREGSTKTGLKTRKPVEFDFSVEYDISYNKNVPPCSAQIRLKPEDVQRFNECCTFGILSPSALKRAFHKYMKRARIVGIYGVKVSVPKLQNGPAVRLVIKHHDIPHEIDVDVTPKIIIPFTHESRGFNWPRGSTYEFLTEKDIWYIKNQPLYLVPKKDTFWSVSFANYESAVLNMFPNTSTEKNILRCAKVRLEAWRTQSPTEMKLISSYILKEAFFWLRENLPDDYLWTHDKCADRYCNFLEELKFCFMHKHLFDYFFPTTDLLAGKENSRSMMIQYLDRELAWIQTNDSVVNTLYYD